MTPYGNCGKESLINVTCLGEIEPLSYQMLNMPFKVNLVLLKMDVF